MEHVRECDLEVTGFDEVMDVMQEDDDLIAPSADGFFNSGNQMNDIHFEFSMSMKENTFSDSAENEMDRDQVSHPSDSYGLEAKNSNRKCNLRKSLAWDSAFFTSAGVLDPEELSSMIGRAEIGERKVLPGIQEDDMRSSISTLDSDTLTLESLEAELFQDVRASIQKSNKIVSTATVPSSNMSISKRESHTSVPSLAKTDLSSENKIKMAMRSTTKKLPKSAAESLKTKKQSRPEVTQDNHDDSCKDFSPSRPKLPNSSGKLCTIPPSPAKRVSTGANHVVPKRPISGVRGAPLAKLSVSSKPSCVVPRPTTTSKFSISVSSKDIKELSTLRSSAESSSSVSSSNSYKSPLEHLKKNNASKTTKPSSSTSTLRVPSRITSKASSAPLLKTKAQPGNSCLTAYVKSTASNISNISPASSISECSIETSSSTSTTNQRSNIQRACVEAAPFSMSGAVEGDYPLAFDSQVQSGDSKIGSDAKTVSGLSNNFTNEPKMHAAFPHTAAVKPSGLRMPSPKIGFFDGVKSLARTPKRALHLNCGVPSGLPTGESICSPSVGSSNAKIGKIQLRTSMNSNKNNDAQPAASVMKPAPHLPGRNPPKSYTKKPDTLEAVKYDPSPSSQLEKGASPKTGGKSRLDPAEITIEIPEGKSHDRYSRQNNTGIGGDVGGTHVNDILHTGEDETSKFSSSLADDPSQQVDKAPSRIDLHKFNSLVEKEEVTSETKVSTKGSIDSNGEGLDLQRNLVISCDACNDGKTASNYPGELEHNSIVNCNNGAPNLLNIPSVTEGSEYSLHAALANINAVHEN